MIEHYLIYGQVLLSRHLLGLGGTIFAEQHFASLLLLFQKYKTGEGFPETQGKDNGINFCSEISSLEIGPEEAGERYGQPI